MYAFRAYSEGIWPPAVKDDRRALAVLANQLEAHGRAFRILHDEDRVADLGGEDHEEGARGAEK